MSSSPQGAENGTFCTWLYTCILDPIADLFTVLGKAHSHAPRSRCSSVRRRRGDNHCSATDSYMEGDEHLGLVCCAAQLIPEFASHSGNTTDESLALGFLEDLSLANSGKTVRHHQRRAQKKNERAPSELSKTTLDCGPNQSIEEREQTNT
eukprot:TRINITY_DN11222_c0_g3_i1.p1 TRINITY_DN11222_c0_g3~~TRINITY_DN11222_c0_g3_i1.p1  ORF type:complete len:151 (+),score=11.85 TRINITY_DN11222_c0_g3_i1:25-477(+)